MTQKLTEKQAEILADMLHEGMHRVKDMWESPRGTDRGYDASKSFARFLMTAVEQLNQIDLS